MAGNITNILDDDDIDLSFLAELDAAESHALSKRRRLTTTTPPPPSSVAEGPYTAALKGSRSQTWQNQPSISALTLPPVYAGAGGGSGGGACFKCGMEGHWARDCSVVKAVNGSESEVVKACACGLGNCLMLTANTERNRGRKFYRCPVRQENGGCGFFEWCDESSGDTSVQDRARKSGRQQEVYQHPSNKETTGFTRTWDDYNKGSTTPNSGYGADNKGYGVKTGSSCFKCGEEGHWARDCPATASSTPTGTAREKPSSNGSFTSSWDDNFKGTSTPNSGYGVKTGSSCFKCGKEGHWSRDCPTTPSSNTSTGVQNSSNGSCFKCGQSGHWAKDCSQSQSTKAQYY